MIVPRRQAAAMQCSCPRDRQCATCLDESITLLTGVARSHGIRWAESVFQRRPDLLREPWPTTPRTASIARAKITGMSRDPRVLERLLAEIQHDAARRWAQLQRDPAAAERILAMASGDDRTRKHAGARDRNQ